MDHFARLGLPAALDIDATALDRAYFAGQRQWHPDRFVNRPPEDRVHASSEAAALNDAYRILKDPLSRAFYLAGLRGVEMPGDGKTIDDPELLMEAMEAREALNEASAPEAVDILASRAAEDKKAGLEGLSVLFSRDDRPAIRKELLRLRYLEKFADEVQARRMALGRQAK